MKQDKQDLDQHRGVDYLGTYYGLEMWGNDVVQAYIVDHNREIEKLRTKAKCDRQVLGSVAIALAVVSILLLFR